MLNTLSLRIAEDLSHSKPKILADHIYLDQLCYGAMAEWVRTITCDVDPALGNNRLGVTRAYLEERGTRVLDQLTKGVLGKEFPLKQLKNQTSWMIDAMIGIQELWVPEQNILACAMNGPVGCWRSRVKYTGHSSAIPAPYRQRGLCRYSLNKVPQEDLQHYENFLQDTKEVQDIFHVKLPVSMDEMEKAIRCADSYSPTTAASYIILKMDITQCDPQVKRFLLMTSWPMNLESLTWDQTDRWMLPL